MSVATAGAAELHIRDPAGVLLPRTVGVCAAECACAVAQFEFWSGQGDADMACGGAAAAQCLWVFSGQGNTA